MLNINRNDRCYCGSGKKYKNCCFIRDNYNNNLPQDALDKLKSEFLKYNQSDLLKKISALQLCSENHSQYIRLETASRIASSCNGNESKEISINQLKNLFLKYLPYGGPIGIQEDPINYLFTYNIQFDGGNYVTFSGRCSSESFILQNILNVIFFEEEFSDDFKNFIRIISLAILKLSDEIASANNISRYEISEDRWHKDVVFPKEEKLNVLKNSVSFSKDKINQIYKTYGLDFRILDFFCLDFNESSFENINVDLNPLFVKPIIKIDDDYIVSIPSALVYSLKYLILSSLDTYNYKELFIEKYQSYSLYKIEKSFKKFLFKDYEYEFPNISPNLPIGEKLFYFDTDKLAYVILVNDSLENYEQNHPFSFRSYKSDYLSDRICLIENDLLELNGINEVFVLIIVSSCGNLNDFYIKKLPQDTIFLTLELEELCLLASSDDYDDLTLWKFAKLLKDYKFSQSDSFLDLFSLYESRNNSFYLSDDGKFDFHFLTTDLNKKFKIKTICNLDRHCEVFNSTFVPVYRENMDEDIYISENNFYHLVKNYSIPIWVFPKRVDYYYGDKVSNILIVFIKAISYWLNQFSADLNQDLRVLNLKSINIIINLEDIPKNFDREEMIIDCESLFNYQFEKNNINIILSNEILKLYANENNELDRFLMKNILRVFGLFLEENGFKNTLSDKRCKLILNKYAPLGLKKNILLFEENFLMGDLPLYRGLQEHDVQCVYDNLGENFIEEYGYEILSKEETRNLSHEIVDYYLACIRSFISNFSWVSLITKLILNYESLLLERQLNDIKLYPYLKCYSDLENFILSKNQENYELNRTAVPLRLLIEIIAAEQDNFGIKEISYDELDKLMALSFNLIQWSFYSDFVDSDYVDVNFQILKSGRIGVKSNISDFNDLFLFSRTLELIDNSRYHFRITDKSIVDEDEINLNSVFNEEFGLSFIDFVDFISELVNFGLKQNKNLVKIYKKDLIKFLSEGLSWENEKSERVIDVFSLKNRDAWEKPPIGFNKEDIMPWHNKRRLSYLLKPLIIEKNDSNSIYYGVKNIKSTYDYLIYLMIYGLYKVDENSSSALKSFIGRMQNMRGEEFNKNVSIWIKDNTPLVVYENVPIKDEDKDYGDVDVLAIDFDRKKIFSIECKSLYYVSNPRDILNEVERFIGGDNSWMEKHRNREKYLKNNLNDLEKKLNLCLTDFNIFSFFIVPHEIPSPYILKLPIEIVTFSDLKKNWRKLFNIN
ncbi:MAG: SEC-C domain-containing protein [Methanobrevibacter sp.]|nr:SEC-C domain-containing protein [Methanobrevibacter sp.]